MNGAFEAFGQYGGVVGLGIAALMFIFKDIVARALAKPLGKTFAYRLVRLMIIFSLVGLVLSVVAKLVPDTFAWQQGSGNEQTVKIGAGFQKGQDNKQDVGK